MVVNKFACFSRGLLKLTLRIGHKITLTIHLDNVVLVNQEAIVIGRLLVGDTMHSAWILCMVLIPCMQQEKGIDMACGMIVQLLCLCTKRRGRMQVHV